MSDTLLLRTRPATVEARRVTAESRDDIVAWISTDGRAWPYGQTAVCWIDADGGGILDAFLGDWVVRTPGGRFERVQDKSIFARYEAVV